MLTQVLRQTLFVPAFTFGRYGLYGRLIIRSLEACQNGRPLSLRQRDGWLILLRQLGTRNVILIVETYTCQHSNRHGCSYGYATEAAPRTTHDLVLRNNWSFIVFQRRGNGCSDVQFRHEQVLVHRGASYLVTRPGGTEFGIVARTEHTPKFKFIRFVIHHRGQRFLQGFTTHSGSSLGCRRCLRLPATRVAGTCRWLHAPERFANARYQLDIA